ncbi:MAG: oxidase [Myxococcales bacterium]|nr:oxidase [Myxococcales bacterium]
MKKFDWKRVTGAKSIANYLDRVRRLGSSTAKDAPLGLESESVRIVPDPPTSSPLDVESLDVWGFRDTGFALDDRRIVMLKGNRYALSGVELPNLLPWVEDVMGVTIEPRDIHAPSYPPQIPAPIKNDAFLAAIEDVLTEDTMTEDAEIRLRHGHGHTQEEMYSIKYGSMPRVPDLVVYPTAEEQVTSLVSLAMEHNVCLIPYGGGTSVTEALVCPENEKRMIVSVDMQRMNRILWIDPVNRMARIEAGAVGRKIVDQLASYGFTMGHEPDSVEFSTLGGWIATHASGMKKNRYGNIEDLVLDVNVVTADGLLERSGVAPRESVGADPRLWVFGSEGNFGIITSAVVRLFPLPEAQEYGSVLFPSFEKGVAFMYELSQVPSLPASVRLVDNEQFQFSMALKPRSEGWRAKKSKLEKFLVTKLKGFDPYKMVACTLVFEGTKLEVMLQKQEVYKLAKKHGGMKAGSENGERGYQLTFGIAYIRDFVMNHYVLAESFETSVPWTETLALCERVKRRVKDEHAKMGLPGTPFITCRVTQVYNTGCCVYFYLAYYYKGVENPTESYNQLEIAAREEILSVGGSLSHHHGIGKIRRRFLPDIMSEASLEWNRKTKSAVDPKNVFGSANQLMNS